MKIKVWIEDAETGKILEQLGTCLTDNISRALQMYTPEEDKWADKGYQPEVACRVID